MTEPQVPRGPLNILLTGGRAPATLDLARSFRAAGHRVFVAESLSGCLSSWSNAVEATDAVPAPRQYPQDFVESLRAILQNRNIDVLIPTCEEIFHVARGQERLREVCPVLVPPLGLLAQVHHKADFVKMAHAMGLRVPPTRVLHTRDDLEWAFQEWSQVVVKPLFSRFGVNTLIDPDIQTAHRVFSTCPAGSLLVQKYLPGEQVCSYSVAQAGKLRAHAAYRTRFTAGPGATIHFQEADHLGVRAWVERFVAETQYTGQIAFDFIEDASGQVAAIECNPRATSGIHLLARLPDFPQAFTSVEGGCLVPPPETQSQVALAMLIYGLPTAVRRRQLRSWWRAFRGAPDVVFRWSDPAPAWGQFAGLSKLALTAARQKISIPEASTWDIEWNGES